MKSRNSRRSQLRRERFLLSKEARQPTSFSPGTADKERIDGPHHIQHESVDAIHGYRKRSKPWHCYRCGALVAPQSVDFMDHSSRYLFVVLRDLLRDHAEGPCMKKIESVGRNVKASWVFGS